jgi:hypothetical protein
MPLIIMALRKGLTVLAIATVTLAVTCCGCTVLAFSTVSRAYAADANYQLIQEPTQATPPSSV